MVFILLYRIRHTKTDLYLPTLNLSSLHLENPGSLKTRKNDINSSYVHGLVNNIWPVYYIGIV